jgi:hypothetical protein
MSWDLRSFSGKCSHNPETDSVFVFLFALEVSSRSSAAVASSFDSLAAREAQYNFLKPMGVAIQRSREVRAAAEARVVSICYSTSNTCSDDPEYGYDIIADQTDLLTKLRETECIVLFVSFESSPSRSNNDKGDLSVMPWHEMVNLMSDFGSSVPISAGGQRSSKLFHA